MKLRIIQGPIVIDDQDEEEALLDRIGKRVAESIRESLILWGDNAQRELTELVERETKKHASDHTHAVQKFEPSLINYVGSSGYLHTCMTTMVGSSLGEGLEAPRTLNSLCGQEFYMVNADDWQANSSGMTPCAICEEILATMVKEKRKRLGY